MAAVPMDYSADVGEPNAGSLEIGGAVKALKHAEELVGVAHIETHAVVANEDDLLGRGGSGADFNLRSFTRASVFKRIGNQVDHDLAEQGGISFHLRQI